MKTGTFRTYTGEDGINISLYPPLDWGGARFSPLEPPRKTFFSRKAEQIDDAEYERQYKEQILDKLDPQEIYNALRGFVLLCWELPIFENRNIINKGTGFCHRHIVSRWLFERLDIIIKEWDPSDEIKKNITFAMPLF